MMFQRLRRGEEFDQCPSCQRILYYRVAPVPDEEGSDDEAEARGNESTA
jgi:hypothetical protein